MNTAAFIGSFCGLVIGIIIAGVAMKVMNTNKKLKSEYDERQQALRGKAYSAGFYSVLAYEALLMILDTAEVSLPVEGSVLHFTALFIGCTVLCSCTIWTDCYWGMNNNRRNYTIFIAFFTILNLTVAILAIVRGAMVVDGLLSAPFINLLCALMIVICGIQLAIKNTLDKRTSVKGGDE